MVVIARKGAGELKWTALDAELLASVTNLGRKLKAHPATERGPAERGPAEHGSAERARD
jgi:hypothetical protein